MNQKILNIGFLLLGGCACCNFRETQEVYLDRPPSKRNFLDAKKILLERHSRTGCKARMIAIGLTEFTFDKFNIAVKFSHPISYYLYGK